MGLARFAIYHDEACLSRDELSARPAFPAGTKLEIQRKPPPKRGKVTGKERGFSLGSPTEFVPNRGTESSPDWARETPAALVAGATKIAARRAGKVSRRRSRDAVVAAGAAGGKLALSLGSIF